MAVIGAIPVTGAATTVIVAIAALTVIAAAMVSGAAIGADMQVDIVVVMPEAIVVGSVVDAQVDSPDTEAAAMVVAGIVKKNTRI
jgi:hypothetical protein